MVSVFYMERISVNFSESKLYSLKERICSFFRYKRSEFKAVVSSTSMYNLKRRYKEIRTEVITVFENRSMSAGNGGKNRWLLM